MHTGNRDIICLQLFNVTLRILEYPVYPPHCVYIYIYIIYMCQISVYQTLSGLFSYAESEFQADLHSTDKNVQ